MVLHSIPKRYDDDEMKPLKRISFTKPSTCGQRLFTESSSVIAKPSLDFRFPAPPCDRYHRADQ
jgi:hypothetical protein